MRRPRCTPDPAHRATRPIQPGQVERREFEYARHGTVSLMAAMNLTTGTIHPKIIAARQPVRERRPPCDCFSTHLYAPETEKFGAGAGIRLAEDLFNASSWMVLGLLTDDGCTPRRVLASPGPGEALRRYCAQFRAEMKGPGRHRVPRTDYLLLCHHLHLTHNRLGVSVATEAALVRALWLSRR